jgi:large conductance mechanosensitive channel
MEGMRIKDFFQEFKTFAVRGNMVELAVGLILGAGFNGIVKSLVDDVVMPPIGFLLGKVDFADLAIYLGEDHYDNLEAARAA